MSSGKTCSYEVSPTEAELQRLEHERHEAARRRELEQRRLAELAEAGREARQLRKRRESLLADLKGLTERYRQQRIQAAIPADRREVAETCYAA